MSTSSEKIKETVRDSYGDIARRFVASACAATPAASSCCGSPDATFEATDNAARLYSADALADLPGSVTDISMGNGNPIALADLQPGEVVLDLGSGGGIDCFLAARQVGSEGRVIGLDVTPEMVNLARRNAKKAGATNVDFRYGAMEDIPLPDESVDVVISNCVINLSTDKDAVFGEIYRVLRPGGRISVADSVVTRGDIPQSVRDDLSKWVGCVAGAIPERDYLDKLRAVGFSDAEIVYRDDKTEPGACGACGGQDAETCVSQTASDAPAEISDYAVDSVRIKARKPA
jgi:arsenite methyltransferase